jgi:formylmethanofuran dehydrogenase subunit B
MALRIVEDVSCVGCGSLCDDLRLTFDGDALVGIEPACSQGETLFRELAALRQSPPPAALVDGIPASLEDALSRCAELARPARFPAIMGLTWLTMEAQREAIAIAEHLGAAILPRNAAAVDSLEATQRVGSISASWGEIRDRADVILYWNAAPPRRHFERFIDPPGRFRPGGRSDRYLLAATDGPDPSPNWADESLQFEGTSGSLAALSALRALANGLEPCTTTELPEGSLATLRRWLERLQSARYGALISGPTAHGYEAELIHRLVRDLNGGTNRFVHMTLGHSGNAAGARAALAWQSGYPAAVDYSGDAPAFRPIATPRRANLEILLGGDPTAHASIAPAIHIGPFATRIGRPEAWKAAPVAIATATPGWDAPGTFLRTDGLAIPLKTVASPGFPTDVEVLRSLRRLLESIP